MTCPFAKLAGILPIAPSSKSHAFHAAHSLHATNISTSSFDFTPTLSEALRVGTSASHRAVEKSRGVSLLLQSVPSSSASTSEQLKFDRLDYVRFQIMLGCVYVVLEASLFTAREARLIAPLFQGNLMRNLARSASVWRDIEAHLETIERHTGSELVDLAEQASEERAFAPSDAGEEQDRENSISRGTLFDLVHKAFPTAMQLCPENTSTVRLTQDHIALLTPAQIHSTLKYVSTLATLSDDQAGLLLAHAYTRYLGDLSGGQHILKKVAKRFPIPSASSSTDGFAFYDFHNSSQLKPDFRLAMEAGLATLRDKQIVIDGVVAEANKAFDLNTSLFESLLPADLRISAQHEHELELELEPEPKQNVPRPSAVLLHTQVAGKGWVRGEMAVVGGVLVAATAAVVVASMLGAHSPGAVGVHA